MGRGVGHPAAAAGRTYRPSLAGKCNNTVMTANVAMHSKKAVGQDAAIQKAAKLPLNKTRNRAVSLRLQRKERFEIPGNYFIKRIVLGISRSIIRFLLANQEAFILGGIIFIGKNIFCKRLAEHMNYSFLPKWRRLQYL
jgi:hypothetical protein